MRASRDHRTFPIRLRGHTRCPRLPACGSLRAAVAVGAIADLDGPPPPRVRPGRADDEIGTATSPALRLQQQGHRRLGRRSRPCGVADPHAPSVNPSTISVSGCVVPPPRERHSPMMRPSHAQSRACMIASLRGFDAGQGVEAGHSHTRPAAVASIRPTRRRRSESANLRKRSQCASGTQSRDAGSCGSVPEVLPAPTIPTVGVIGSVRCR